MASALFELRGVYFSYFAKIPALCGIDLSIEQGSKAAIIGANGTGKSTLLTMLDALIFPDAGSITAFGRELKEGLLDTAEFSRFFRGRVGFVFQNPEVQLFCPTVKEDIVFGPLQLGAGRGEINKRLEEVVSELRIAGLLERPAHQLSIGEKRKAAIASVLIMAPEVLLLDEPTAGLDPQTTRDIIDILLAQNQCGRTIVIATHDMHLVGELADTVHVIGGEKKIARSGPAAEILSDLAFLQENNFVHVHRHRHDGLIHTHPHAHKQAHHQ